MVMGNSDPGEITVKMVISGEELQGLMGNLPAGASVAVSQTPMLVNVEKGIRTSPTFLSIFKPLLALEAVKSGIKNLLQNSSIMNTYMGAMGKMFGAAVDLLLLPFTPLLNLMMLAMGKLLQWLVTSGLLEAISKGVNRVVDFLKDVGGDLRNIWNDIKNLDMKALLPDIGTLLRDSLGFAVKHPIEAGVLAIVAAIAAAKVANIAGGLLGGGAAGVGGGAAGGAAAGAAGMPLAGVALAAGMLTGGAYVVGKGAQVATDNMWDIIRGKGGSALNVAKGTMAYNIFNPLGMGAALSAYGGAKAIGGIRGLFGGGGGGGGDKSDEMISQQQETNSYLRTIAGSWGTIRQTVTINGAQQPEITAQQLLEQAKMQGLSTSME